MEAGAGGRASEAKSAVEEAEQVAVEENLEPGSRRDGERPPADDAPGEEKSSHGARAFTGTEVEVCGHRAVAREQLHPGDAAPHEVGGHHRPK